MTPTPSASSFSSSIFDAPFPATPVPQAEWTEHQDSLLLSFLQKPLFPLSTAFPPSTLPPSSALDEITSQILHFHRPPSSTAPQTSKHSRTRSLSAAPWVHSFAETRARLFDLARKEAIGGAREDRWKERIEGGMPVSGGTVERRLDGLLEVRRDGSLGGLPLDAEFPEERIDSGREGMGQVLRLVLIVFLASLSTFVLCTLFFRLAALELVSVSLRHCPRPLTPCLEFVDQIKAPSSEITSTAPIRPFPSTSPR